MNLNNLSAKKICRLVSAGMVFSMLVITGIFGGIMQDIRIFIVGGTLTLCAFFWIWLLVLIFGKRLSHFTSNLCRTLDNMIDGNEELQKSNDSETLFARINHRLIRLYEIMQKNRHKVDMERQELQMLISDISHQVKTPVSNLQMVTDTLLTKPVSEEERMDFLQGIRSQTDKLDFLFQALVKTSRLETGAIRLEKKDSSLFHTLAQAMSSIVYAAEKKEIAVSVDCPENLIISHDSKVCFMNMCMVQDDKGNVLALDKVNDSYTGTTFPGGHVEQNEIFQKSIIREVWEETGLTIESPKLCGLYHWHEDGVHSVIMLYKAEKFIGELKSSEEGQVYWIPLEELKTRELATGMKYVLQILGADQVNECYMHLESEGYVGDLY